MQIFYIDIIMLAVDNKCQFVIAHVIRTISNVFAVI